MEWRTQEPDPEGPGSILALTLRGLATLGRVCNLPEFQPPELKEGFMVFISRHLGKDDMKMYIKPSTL